MKSNWPCRTVAALACLTGAGQALAQAPYLEDEELALDRSRVIVGARFAFGITARVTNLSTAPPAAPDYHNGFVRPDISGNADGLTWYWGYQSDSQVVGNELLLSSATSSPSDGQVGESDDQFQGGFEVLYAREMGRIQLGKRSAPWGFEAGVTSLNTLLETQDQYSGMISVRTDRYNLGTTVPPLAPYQGSYEGPGPLIGSTPSGSQLQSAAATSDVSSEIETLLVGLKLGPFIEFPLTRRLHLNVSGGAAVMAAITDFSFSETVNVPGIPQESLSRSDEDSDTQFVAGAYVQASVSYAVTEFLSVYLGGQYQYLGDVSFESGGKEATVEFSKAFELVLGLRTSF